MTPARRVYAAVVESRAFRTWSRSSRGRAVLESRGRAVASSLARRAAVTVSRRRHPDLFADTSTCFLMVGHTKSGGTLLGSLLDAHPDVVCADELGLAKMLVEEEDVDAAFRLAVRNSERELARGRVTSRRVEPYSLRVPGWRQGLAGDRPRAIGDSRAGPTTRFLASDFTAIGRIEGMLGTVSLRFIQVVRNPFDPIAFMVARSGRDVFDAISDFREQCDRLVGLGQQAGGDAIKIIRYEDLVTDTEVVLADVCRFLGVGADAAYLEACTSIVGGGRSERNRIEWTPASLGAVAEVIAAYPFLGGYAFEVAP